MSTFDVLYFAGAVSTFVILAALLAWDEYRTRHISR